MRPDPSIPLSGLRVVDLTTSVAGPFCTLILGALGADIVKVERPGAGDDTRSWGPPFWNGESAMHLAMNSNKRSIAVDIKSLDGAEVVRRLVSGAAVFIQSLRPGAAEAAGLGFDAVAEIQPNIVYCSITAFGETGPLRGQPGYDPLMQALAGIMSVTGEETGAPVRAGVSLVDQGTSLWATIAILAALRGRDRGACAQLIDTSLYETAVSWMGYHIAGYLGSSITPGPLGSSLGMIAPYEAFESADARIMVAAPNDRLFKRLCESIGLDSLADDRRFRCNADRVANRAALAELLGARFAEADAAEWVSQLTIAGVPVAPLQDVAQAIQHEQTTALGILQSLPHPKIDDLRLPGPPWSVNSERMRLRTAAPMLGEHSLDILVEAGYTLDEVSLLVESGAVSKIADATRDESVAV